MAYLGKNTLTYNDFGAESSSVTVFSDAITAANHDAQVAALGSLVTALEGITIGLKVRQEYSNFDQILSSASEASNAFAQRETKWLVRYKRPTGTKVHKMEIPCADLAFLDTNNKGYLDLGSTEGAAFVSAFEAFATDPEGNAVEVISVQHVGRNI